MVVDNFSEYLAVLKWPRCEISLPVASMSAPTSTACRSLRKNNVSIPDTHPLHNLSYKTEVTVMKPYTLNTCGQDLSYAFIRSQRVMSKTIFTTGETILVARCIDNFTVLLFFEIISDFEGKPLKIETWFWVELYQFCENTLKKYNKQTY